MSRGETPYMSHASETAPLDLTVKRLDMDGHAHNMDNHAPILDSHAHNVHNHALGMENHASSLDSHAHDMESHTQDMHHGMQHYEYDRYGSYGHPGGVAMNSEYAYNQYAQMSGPDSDYQYTTRYCPDVAYNQSRHAYETPPLPVTNSSFNTQPGTYSSSSSGGASLDQDSLDSYQSSGTSSAGAPYESSIIPKKRKIIWRPYDSKLLLGQNGSEVDKESDSGSDSTSGSYSDQEFKTLSPPADPVKKRKTHRSHSTIKESKSDEYPVKSGNPDIRDQMLLDNTLRKNPSGDNDINEGPTRGNWYMTPSSEESTNQSQAPSKPASHGAKVNVTSRASTETREKMISGLKKRDIFGWSLKLKNPSVTEDSPAINGPDSSPTGEQRVCKDGNKTYTELQTVKKAGGDASPDQNGNTAPTPTRSQPAAQSASILSQQNMDTLTQQAKSPLKDNDAVDNKGTDSDKENKESNYVSKKVYIQRRDNIIECCNEADSKKEVKPETKKGLSLIDLVEEIEASARVIDKDEVEKNNQKNRNIVKLLEQCNHVKLQALDYLMANVLIQDKQRQFKCKNENVQRMLKGDKISSVNMLDVVELQVEIGLN